MSDQRNFGDGTQGIWRQNEEILLHTRAEIFHATVSGWSGDTKEHCITSRCMRNANHEYLALHSIVETGMVTPLDVQAVTIQSHDPQAVARSNRQVAPTENRSAVRPSLRRTREHSPLCRPPSRACVLVVRRASAEHTRCSAD